MMKDSVRSMQRNFRLIIIATLGVIIISEFLLLSFYYELHKNNTKYETEYNRESKTKRLKHLLEQLESEINFAVRHEWEEEVNNAEQRVTKFVETAEELNLKTTDIRSTQFYEYIKTINKYFDENYIYIVTESPDSEYRTVQEEKYFQKKLLSDLEKTKTAIISYPVHDTKLGNINKTSFLKKSALNKLVIGSGFYPDKSTLKIQKYIISQLQNMMKTEKTFSFFMIIDNSKTSPLLVKSEGQIDTDSAYMERLINRLGNAKSTFFYELSADKGGLRTMAVRHIKKWNWIVCIGFAEADSLPQKEKEAIALGFRSVVFFSIVLTLLLIIFSYYYISDKRKRFMSSLVNEYRSIRKKTRKFKQLGKKMKSTYTAVSEHEQELKKIMDELRIGVATRIRDLQEVNIHLHRENMKIARAGEHLIAARKKANQASIVKSEFLANMSHEVRTPIHAVLSYASFGFKRFDKKKDEKQKYYFSKIEESADRLLSLIKDLIDLADLESGRMKYRITKLDVKTVLNDCIQALERSIFEKRHTFSVPDESAVICADEKRLRQVFMNLYSNAAKFSPQESIIHTTIAVENNFVIITVADSGCGVSESEKNIIFDKFVQSSKTNTGAGGIGLGLAICREIVTDHGGRIYVKDNPEGGSLFIVELPMF